MPSINDLTDHQRVFAKRYFEIGNCAQAYRDTHPDFTGDEAIAANLGYQLKARIIAKVGYGEFLEFAGLTDAMLTNKLKDLVDSNDERVGLGATKLGMQLRGRLVEKSEVELSGKKPFTDILREQEEQAAKEQAENDKGE